MNSAEKQEEMFLGEIKLGEHLHREELKNQEHVSWANVLFIFK